LILAGRVQLAGRVLSKPGASVAPGASLEIERPRPFVSRGGEKLEGALAAFTLDVSGAHALDVGASTGGFTDCLLSRGAADVVALDVGYGQIAWPLRTDPRVTVVERCNFRLLPDDAYGPQFDIVTIDASFISVVTLIARARAFLAPGGAIVALVKPQFEAGRERLGSGGVVRDPAVHRAILHEVTRAVAELGLVPRALARSPLVGPAGNVEFFLLAGTGGVALEPAAIDALASDGAA
jgi:23S rRNA (cytidine1920-2'-O)/16S rRNA (cytidine1409-2'-O)-methyltransferase